MRFDKNKKILLDADVIIHFIKGEQLGILNKIFPNKLYIIHSVFKEVYTPSIRVPVENLIKFKIIHELDFTGQMDVIKEYARLKRTFGSGESACMAYCKYHKDVLASSNLTDIKKYCKENDIQYITTMDFIAEAYRKEILDETACDFFIYNVKSKGSKLPNNSIRDYLESKSR